MSSRLRYLQSALDDLDGIAHYLTGQSGSEEVGMSFIDRLTEHCERLAELPGTLGSDRQNLLEDMRSTPSRGYVIYFRYAADAVEIVNVLHASRDAEAHFHG